MVGFQTFWNDSGPITQSRDGFVLTPGVFRRHRNLIEDIPDKSFSLIQRKHWESFLDKSGASIEDFLEEYSEDHEGKLIVIHQNVLCPFLNPGNIPIHYSFRNLPDDQEEIYMIPFLVTPEFVSRFNKIGIDLADLWTFSYKKIYQFFSSDDRSEQEIIRDIITWVTVKLFIMMEFL